MFMKMTPKKMTTSKRKTTPNINMAQALINPKIWTTSKRKMTSEKRRPLILGRTQTEDNGITYNEDNPKN